LILILRTQVCHCTTNCDTDGILSLKWHWTRSIIVHTSCGDQIYALYFNSEHTYIVKALTKNSELRNEKPLNNKNDQLNALEVYSCSLGIPTFY